MSSRGFLLRLPNDSAADVENDDLIRRFDPFKARDFAKQIALAICGAEMVLATPANIRVSWILMPGYFDVPTAMGSASR